MSIERAMNIIDRLASYLLESIDDCQMVMDTLREAGLTDEEIKQLGFDI